MTEQKFIAKMTGYKATKPDMTCQGFKFELGVWYEVDSVEMCKKGFHFCIHPSGPYAHYPFGSRIFKCEAEQVLDIPVEPGSDFKLVAKRIRLVEEITPDSKTKWNTGDRNTGDGNTGNWNTGKGNTGDWNTGNWNTGDRNTGDWNTGDRNTGDRNTGYWNTGDRNTGDRNTGNWNTGNGNTGDGNTGNWNTGNWNTGDRNTGNWNTGNRNTGNGNVTNFSSGFFCSKEPKVICFDVQTKLTRSQFQEKYPEYSALCQLLHKPEPIDFNLFKRLPGITKSKLIKLHEMHIEKK